MKRLSVFAMLAALTGFGGAVSTAQALPIGVAVAGQLTDGGNIERVGAYDGCGPGFHRHYGYGRCMPNRKTIYGYGPRRYYGGPYGYVRPRPVYRYYY